jgi:molybdopterin molybdotransferase
MITIEEALERILAYVSVLPAEDKHPLNALGQVLDEDVVADFDIPPLDNTSMDGYVVRASDTAGATEKSPRELRVIGEVAAGYIYDGEVEPGTAVRIMTGAPIPRGADGVVPFEETDEPFDRAPEKTGRLVASVKVFKEAQSGANIRPADQDVRAGDVVLRRGAGAAAAGDRRHRLARAGPRARDPAARRRRALHRRRAARARPAA